MASWGKGAGLLQLLTVAYSSADPPCQGWVLSFDGVLLLQGGKGGLLFVKTTSAEQFARTHNSDLLSPGHLGETPKAQGKEKSGALAHTSRCSVSLTARSLLYMFKDQRRS